MKKIIISLSVLFGLLFVSAAPIVSAAVGSIGQDCSSSTDYQDSKSRTFFGLPVWYEYIQNGESDGLGNCVPNFSFPGDFSAIGFAAIDMLLRVAGLLAVVYIIIAGVAFVTAQGQPDKAVAARQKIINALIGLMIAVVAVPIVHYIGTRVFK